MKEFPAFEIKEEQNNLILGSSNEPKITLHDTHSLDCAIHAYRASTKKKSKVWEKYENRNNQTCVLQDSTNSIMK